MQCSINRCAEYFSPMAAVPSCMLHTRLDTKPRLLYSWRVERAGARERECVLGL